MAKFHNGDNHAGTTNIRTRQKGKVRNTHLTDAEREYTVKIFFNGHYPMSGGSPVPLNPPMRRLESCSNGWLVCEPMGRLVLRLDFFFFAGPSFCLFLAFAIYAPVSKRYSYRQLSPSFQVCDRGQTANSPLCDKNLNRQFQKLGIKELCFCFRFYQSKRKQHAKGHGRLSMCAQMAW
jgi:hypothetical protein